MKPYAYKTTDFGKTWTPLVAGGAPVRGYAHVIKEDLVNPRSPLPRHRVRAVGLARRRRSSGRSTRAATCRACAVRDLAIHPRDNDLVIATHGRGIWIVDDITPLRALTPETLAQGRGVRRRPTPVVQQHPGVRRLGERRRGVRRRESAGRRGDHLLPAKAPHLRRHEDRGARLDRQARATMPTASAAA